MQFKRYSDSSHGHDHILGCKEITSQQQLEELAHTKSENIDPNVNVNHRIIDYHDLRPSAITSSRYWRFYYAPRPIFIINLVNINFNKY